MSGSTATPEQVKAITGSVLDDTQIEPFIAAATCIIDSLSVCMAAKGVVPGCSTQAEAWLASHLLSISGVGEKLRVKRSEKFENYSVEWAMGKIEGQGVMSTTYGQTANDLTGGCLSEVGKSPAVICMFG